MNLTSTAVFAALIATVPLSAADYRISGPYTHENLSVFLIHGADQSSRRFLTLQEALAQKKVVVYETGNVNELAIENVSSNDDVYIQSGDIVKGGQQDRTFKDDLILNSRSGRVPISAFCVEHGRWSRRGSETVTHFDSANASVATREMKKAVRLSANQSEVWRNVEAVQQKLGSSMRASVAAPASPTSFMLSLESPALRKPVEDYVKALASVIDKQGDAVGYAFAVNGKVSSADVYGSKDLFRKLWPKLLHSSAVEAVAERHEGEKADASSVEAVHAMMTDAAKAPGTAHDVSGRTQVVVKQSAANALFETRDKANAESVVHRSYLVK